MSNPVPGRANRNAAVTGVLIRYFGWRMAFIIPGIVCIMCGLVFAACATRDASAPAKPQASADGHHAGISVAKVLLIMTVAAASGGMLFNFSTSSNYALLSDKFSQISQDPARIGALLALVNCLGLPDATAGRQSARQDFAQAALPGPDRFHGRHCVRHPGRGEHAAPATPPPRR